LLVPCSPARAADELVAEQKRELRLVFVIEWPGVAYVREEGQRVALEDAEGPFDVVDGRPVRSLAPVERRPTPAFFGETVTLCASPTSLIISLSSAAQPFR
jgi:hypothetical protein